MAAKKATAKKDTKKKPKKLTDEALKKVSGGRKSDSETTSACHAACWSAGNMCRR